MAFFALGFVCVTGLRLSGVLVGLDQMLYLWAQGLSYSNVWIRVWEMVTSAGEGYFVYPVVAVPALVHIIKGKNQKTWGLIFLMIVLFNLNPLLKILFALPRPVSLSPYTDLSTHSFPSGHAVNGVVLFYFLPRFAALVFGESETKNLKSAWFFIPGIVLIALSRVVLGAHWLSDVVGGVCVGFVISDLLITLTRAKSSVAYRAIIFDLDGTLIDSKQDIVTSTNATLKAMGGKALPSDLVAAHVGHGVRDLVHASLKSAGVQADESETLAFFSKHYFEHCLDSTHLFPGVLELLQNLKSRGIKLAVFTNKPQIYTDRILAGLNVSGFFDVVLGSDNGYPNKPDPQGTRMILEKLGTTPGETLMVGDSDVDLKTAQNVGLDTALYLHGFSTPETILSLKNQTCLVFGHHDELASFLNNCRATCS